jgi:hypothetical protein
MTSATYLNSRIKSTIIFKLQLNLIVKNIYPILQGHYLLTTELSVLNDEIDGQDKHLLFPYSLQVAQL